VRALVVAGGLGWMVSGQWWVGIGTVAICYLLEACLFAVGRCMRCRGRGWFTSWFSRGRRPCGACGGSGRRLRVGRVLVGSWRSRGDF
jgi:hypothetical protein